MSEHNNNDARNDKTELKTEPKDGFDLVEYPCDYLFKAMCKAHDEVETVLQTIVLETVAEHALLEIRSSHSRTRKFQSVSLTVRLNDRQELEKIYQQIADSEHVVMTL